MKDPINTDKAFWDTSSDTISSKDLGVAEPLAAEKAESIEPTANIAITSITLEMVESKSSREPFSISGTISEIKVSSARWAINAPAIDNKQKINGLNHNLSDRRLIKKLIFSFILF